jgi:hypothetical protein
MIISEITNVPGHTISMHASRTEFGSFCEGHAGMCSVRSLIFWDVMQYRLVVSYLHFRTTYIGAIFKGQVSILNASGM